MAEREIDVAAFRDFEEAGWEERAVTYSDSAGRITSLLVEPLLDAASVAAGMRVLDVATGPGYAAALAMERGASVVGVDIAEAMVELARRLHPHLDVRRGSAEALPFASESFDAVVANFLIPHLAEPERVGIELVRVLRSGGYLALTTWDVPTRSLFPGILVDATVGADVRPPPDLPVGPPMFRFADDGEFAGLLSMAGLHTVTVQTVEFVHRVRSSDQLWDEMLAGSLRAKPLLAGQSPEVAAGIRSAFDARLEQLGDGDGFALPVSVKLASGQKR